MRGARVWRVTACSRVITLKSCPHVRACAVLYQMDVHMPLVVSGQRGGAARVWHTHAARSSHDVHACQRGAARAHMTTSLKPCLVSVHSVLALGHRSLRGIWHLWLRERPGDPWRACRAVLRLPLKRSPLTTHALRVCPTRPLCARVYVGDWAWCCNRCLGLPIKTSCGRRHGAAPVLAQRMAAAVCALQQGHNAGMVCTTVMGVAIVFKRSNAVLCDIGGDPGDDWSTARAPTSVGIGRCPGDAQPTARAPHAGIGGRLTGPRCLIHTHAKRFRCTHWACGCCCI